MSAFAERVENKAWRTKPSWAVIATEDQAFDQATLRQMADRIGARVTEVPTSHAVFMTRADVVAATIHHAATTSAPQHADPDRLPDARIGPRTPKLDAPDKPSCSRSV